MLVNNMKQIYKNKIREIRQLVMVSKVDVQTILDALEKDLEQLEEKIDILETKDNLTYTQEERLDALHEEYDTLDSYRSNVEDIIIALEELEDATNFLD